MQRFKLREVVNALKAKAKIEIKEPAKR